MVTKPVRNVQSKQVNYTKKHWTQLWLLRNKAADVMSALEKAHLPCIVHGSVARGDVKAGSDVDVFIPDVQSSFQVETALELSKIAAGLRWIVQATPTYAVKAHIEIGEFVTVTFPLMSMRRVEREFYRFGGEVNLAQLKIKVRVAGVDKRLMLIEPTKYGHLESSVVGKEEFVANFLGVSVETVRDRVHALLKRDTVGRTGVFVKREVMPDETFELALKKLCESNAAVRRRMKKLV
jgi:predicted nucleotidyltransferase